MSLRDDLREFKDYQMQLHNGRTEVALAADVDMGTYKEAEDRFLGACDRWIAARQPLMANAAAHRKRDAEEHEARFQLANAAIHLAWHMRNPDCST